MAVFEEVEQLKSQGVSDQQIISYLRERGVSPKEISDALAQTSIKNAVAQEAGASELQSSIMTENTPMPQEMIPAPQNQNYQQGYGYAPEGNYYQEQAFMEQPQSSGMTSEMVIDLAEQVVNEKIRPIQKMVDQMQEFKSITEVKLENVQGRLKRIETMIDDLQIRIIEKVGLYGSNIESIKKEMNMIEESFAKISGDLAEKRRR